jgi:hypothetical protein
MAEAAMLRNLFPDILWPIAELYPPPNYETHLDHKQSPIQHGVELYGPRSISIISLAHELQNGQVEAI